MIQHDVYTLYWQRKENLSKQKPNKTKIQHKKVYQLRYLLNSMWGHYGHIHMEVGIYIFICNRHILSLWVWFLSMVRCIWYKLTHKVCQLLILNSNYYYQTWGIHLTFYLQQKEKISKQKPHITKIWHKEVSK